MRILKITSSYFPYVDQGGPPVKVRGLARGLAELGHEVTVLTADRGEAVGVEQRPETRTKWRAKTPWGWEANDDGVRTIYLPTLSNYRATTLNPRVVSYCSQNLHEFDVLHIYGLYDLLGLTVAWFCRRRRIPYVLEPLGMFGAKIRSHRKKRIYAMLSGRQLFSGAQAVIATSEKERQELIDGGINRDKVLLRRNGIDLSQFQNLPQRGVFRTKYNVAFDIPLALFIGRLSFIKGLDLLVRSFALAPPESKLVIAGPDDNDGCLSEVRKAIAELQLEGRVQLIGPIYGEEKLAALRDADVLVLPSRYESFGNVAAEAVACGTPVLLTDQCGIAPLLDGTAGLVVQCEVDAMAEGLSRLLSDAALRERMSSNCSLVAKQLSWDQPVAEMERLYRTLTFEKVGSNQTAALAGGAEFDAFTRDCGVKR